MLVKSTTSSLYNKKIVPLEKITLFKEELNSFIICSSILFSPLNSIINLAFLVNSANKISLNSIYKNLFSLGVNSKTK